MKRIMFYLTTISLAAFFISSCSDGRNKSHAYKDEIVKSIYVCPMHPQVREKRPGKCPICSMELTRIDITENSEAKSQKKKTTEGNWACEDYPDITAKEFTTCPIDGTPMIKIEADEQKVFAAIKLKENQSKHFKASVFKVQPMQMKKKIRLLGKIVQAQEKKSFIPARVPGRVEEVFLKSEGQFVRKGQQLLVLYSPELISAGEEYLIAVKNLKNAVATGNNISTFKSLAERSREKLKLWGITDSQLKFWLKNESVPEKITIYSPVTGIIQKMYARQGSYFKEGQNFFAVVDLSLLWVELDVYEHDSGMVKLAQEVKITSPAFPGDEWNAPLDFVSPFLNEDTHTLKVRASIDNREGKLKPGMLVDANLQVVLENTPLVIPQTAIIDTGKRKIVWVDLGGMNFEAREVKSGFESQGYTEIKSGLLKDEMVVVKGNFLLDAQSELLGKYESNESSEVENVHAGQ